MPLKERGLGEQVSKAETSLSTVMSDQLGPVLEAIAHQIYLG